MLCFGFCGEKPGNTDCFKLTTKCLWCLYRLEFRIGSDERITAQAHKGLICNNSFVPAARFRLCCAAEFYILTGLLSGALLIVSIPACRSNRYKHFLLPLGFSAGCIWFTFNYLPVLRSLPPLAWVSTSVSLRVCSADRLRRLVPISSMAAVWVCTAVLFTSSIPERTFSWMMFSSCVEHKRAVNIVSYGNQTSDLPHHHPLPSLSALQLWRPPMCISRSRPYCAMQSQALQLSGNALVFSPRA